MPKSNNEGQQYETVFARNFESWIGSPEWAKLPGNDPNGLTYGLEFDRRECDQCWNFWRENFFPLELIIRGTGSVRPIIVVGNERATGFLKAFEYLTYGREPFMLQPLSLDVEDIASRVEMGFVGFLPITEAPRAEGPGYARVAETKRAPQVTEER